MANPTLYDILVRNSNQTDLVAGLIEDVTTYAPEFSTIPVVTRPGVTYKVVSRTSLPTAQFRQVNQGIAGSKSVYKEILKEMYYADTQIVVDEALVKADDGQLGNLLAQEGMGALQNTIINIGAQTYAGAVGDGSNGFVGLRQQLANTASAATSGHTSEVTSSTTAYLVWLTPQGISYDVGQGGAVSVTPPQKQLVYPTTNGSGYMAWVSNIGFYVGFSVKSNQSAFAVTGISADGTDNNPLTDKVGSKLLELVPVARRNGLVWFMSRKGHGSLQRSRTSIGNQPAGPVNAGPAWSPPPLECEGYKIIVTDSIKDNDDNT